MEEKKDPSAGYKFGQYVRRTGKIIPFILGTLDATNATYATELVMLLLYKKRRRTFHKN